MWFDANTAGINNIDYYYSEPSIPGVYSAASGQATIAGSPTYTITFPATIFPKDNGTSVQLRILARVGVPMNATFGIKGVSANIYP